MSLKPGTPRKVNNEYRLDDTALSNSMALAIDEEMAAVYEAVKGVPMPEAGEEDRRILFTAIARGVLKYLRDNSADFVEAIAVKHTDESEQEHTVEVTGFAGTIKVSHSNTDQPHTTESETKLDIEVGTIP